MRDLRRLRLQKIGFIFQTHNLLPFLTGIENVMEVLELAAFHPLSARAQSGRLAANTSKWLVGGIECRAQLSGGEAQRVAIARAFANGPRIILADEPTAPLEFERAGIVMDLLRRIASEQEAAIIVRYPRRKPVHRFDRIFQLKDGRLATPPVASATAPHQGSSEATTAATVGLAAGSGQCLGPAGGQRDQSGGGTRVITAVRPPS